MYEDTDNTCRVDGNVQTERVTQQQEDGASYCNIDSENACVLSLCLSVTDSDSGRFCNRLNEWLYGDHSNIVLCVYIKI
jgi:hypothetical protein